jgi:hypothetical protein
LRPETGRLEPQRIEHARRNQLLPTRAGSAFEHRADQHKSHVRIGEFCARRRLQRLLHQLLHQPVAQFIEVQPLLRVGLQQQLLMAFVVAGNAAGVRQQLLERDGFER